MGSDVSTVKLEEVLAVFEQRDRPAAPLTAPEVAEALGCARRTAYNKLTTLTEQGSLATKKVGARARIWWQPTNRTGASRTTTRDRPTGGNERALRELHDATRRLMGAETHEAVCTIAVEAAQDILGLSLSGVWLHDPDRDVLEPAAWTESGVEEYGEPPPFPVEGSLVGRVFREGTYRAYDDITTEGDLYDPDTSVRSELVLPLGEHGVLNASSPTVGAFDAIDTSLGRILAANVETALDRADQLERRRARRRELERQRNELETLNRINALIQDTIGALVEAATRTQIERTVCERLAASEFYVDAWIAERDPSSGEAVLRTGVSSDDGSDEFVVELDGTPHPDPIAAALDDATPQVIPGIADDERLSDRLRTVAVASGARACLVVPLTYAETVFGALVVHAPVPDAFSDREQMAFETLGQVVGFAINATNNRQLLLGNTAIELEVAVQSDAWFLSVADGLDAPVTVEGLVPLEDGTVIEYVTVEDGADGTAPAALAETPAIGDARVLVDDDDHWVLECIVRQEEARLAKIAEYGATIRTVRAADGTGTVTARFPATTSARDAMAVIQEAFPTAELVAKRVVDVSDRSVTTVRQAVADRLTEKQLTALRAAYLAGYYDSPRGTTAQELADSLNIVPSTLYQHLQAAHRKLLTTVFDELSG